MTDDVQALARVRSSLERYVRMRGDGDGPTDREDVVQEAMVRLLENRSRLDPEAWEAYALVSIRNLLRDRDRAGEVRRRHRHRLHAPDLTSSAEEQVLTEEEHAALRRAMTTLPREDATLLHRRYGREEPDDRSLSPASATRLARARARLRVAYLLEHTRLPLPTPRCRPVLEALSSGDRRRQERLGAGRHLVACRVCATYAPVLARRERALAALHPLGWITVAGGAAWAAVRRHPARSGTATAAGVVLVAGGFALGGSGVGGGGPEQQPQAGARSPVPSVSAPAAPDPDAPDPDAPAPAAPAPAAPAGTVTLADSGRPLLPRDGTVLPPGRVEAVDVPVQAVTADEAFWVGERPGQRLWVRLVGEGESPAAVEVGDRVSFTGEAVPVPAGYTDSAGVTDAEGRGELEGMRTYVEVPSGSVVVARR